jgi:hypothetical protein
MKEPGVTSCGGTEKNFDRIKKFNRSVRWYEETGPRLFRKPALARKSFFKKLQAPRREITLRRALVSNSSGTSQLMAPPSK